VLVAPTAAFALWPSAAAEEPIRLESLTSPSDTVTFDFISSGCFSWSRYLLRYEPGSVPRLVVKRPPDSYSFGGGVVSRLLSGFQLQTVAVVGLSRPQVQGLDRLLQFYRTLPPGYCTQSNAIKVSRYWGSWRVRTEDYFDDSCRSDLLADAHPRDLRDLGIRASPLVTLDRVIGVADIAAQRGLTYTRYIPLARTKTRAYTKLRFAPGREIRRARRSNDHSPAP
jgi:hypothetical protein